VTHTPTIHDPTREVSSTDRVVTTLLMIGLALLVPVAGFMGLLTSMASDPCGSSTSCNTGLIGLGVIISTVSVAVAFLVALVWAIVRWRSGRTTWWVPLVALVAGAALWLLGAVITFSAVG
jgi:uncharacterized BrkB/YihY/UPF0761 family membrane protein